MRSTVEKTYIFLFRKTAGGKVDFKGIVSKGSGHEEYVETGGKGSLVLYIMA